MSHQKLFEVGVYNEEVRELEKEGRRHGDISMDWSETHYIEVRAETEEEARAKISSRYPAHRGYVIVDVSEIRLD